MVISTLILLLTVTLPIQSTTRQDVTQNNRSSRILQFKRHDKIEIINRKYCMDGCKVCEKFNGNLDCLECLPGHILKNNKCNLCYLYGCGKCDHTLKKCFRCAPGFFDSSPEESKRVSLVMHCSECTKNCKFCNNSDSCEQCNFGFYSNSSKKCVVDNSWIWIISIILIVIILAALVFLFRNKIAECLANNQKNRKKSRSKSRKSSKKSKNGEKGDFKNDKSKSKRKKYNDNKRQTIELEDVIPQEDSLVLN